MFQERDRRNLEDGRQLLVTAGNIAFRQHVAPASFGQTHRRVAPSRAKQERPAKRESMLASDSIVGAPEILVPSDERLALTQFVAGLARRREVALALARPAPFEPGPETAPGGPLEIAKLEVPPLISVNEK